MKEQELMVYRKLCQEADDLRKRIKQESNQEIIQSYRAKLTEAEQKKTEIEQFISRIADPELRLIFRYRFLDGKRLAVIGTELSMDRSSVGKKINAYLKLSPNSHLKRL